jgi:hypothetical protein
LKVTIANLTKGKLPIDLPHEAIDPDQWPSVNEIMHWSGRMSHAALALAIGLGWRCCCIWPASPFAAHGPAHRKSGRSRSRRAIYHAFRWAFLAGGMASAAGGNRLVDKLWSGIEGFVVPALTGWVLFALVRTGGRIDEPPRHRIGR